MAIPEAQLTTWSAQGSIVQSSTTYATVKAALESAQAKYKDRNFEVFLQGSYGNDTNIFAESDVDVVIRHDSGWYRNLDSLPTSQAEAYKGDHSVAAYPYGDFKSDVHKALKTAFGSDVQPGKRAFNILANGNRRSADVIVAFQFRNYVWYNTRADSYFDPNGIGFLTSPENKLIANYPKQHSANLTVKHQATNKKFKYAVRIFKNMRSRLVNDGLMEDGVAASYFIECLLYNAPPELYVGTYSQIVRALLVWMSELPNRAVLECAHGNHSLIGESNPACWPDSQAQTFINAAIKLWNEWT